MPLLLSDEELDALEGLTDFQFRLYVQGIRRHMDYKSGIVGIKRKVSLGSLASETYTEKIKGVKQTGNKSRFQVHRAIKRLENAGLVEIKSVATKDEKQLILDCVLAVSDKSKQNKAATWPQHSPATEAATLKNEENPINKGILEDLDNAGRNSSRTSENEKAAIYPISDITKLYTQQAIFRNLLNDQGFRPEQILNVKTMAMVNVWIEAGVTEEEARIGIESVNAKNKPGHPTYYKNPVLQVKGDFKKALSETENAKRQPTQTNRTNRPVSKTQQFWDAGINALEQYYKPKD